MMTDLLKQVYASQTFKSSALELVDDLTQHLEDSFKSKAKTINWSSPADSLEFWRDFLKNGEEDALFKEVLKRSTHVHNPKYMGHQISPAAPVTLLTSMLSAALNNGTAVYEMGMTSNPIERIITELLASKIGYSEHSSGFLTSGGTLANLTALLTARKAKVKADVWNEGHTIPLGIMVSEEAHYCIERAAKIMGMGEEGIIKIPSNANFSMNVSELEKQYNEATQKGIQVFAIVGSAPATATGTFDDLESIGNFATKHNLWFHADAAHGGAALFSSKYAYALKGISKSDSVVIDGHKMMMMPGITTALVFKDQRTSNATFSQKADYLLELSTDADWYNSGKRTFECTKNMMCLHWFVLLKTYGADVFGDFVTTLYDLGQTFAQLINQDDTFELAVHPSTNIVCFRYVDQHLSTNATNKINKEIRQQLLEEGDFYIVQTKLRGVHCLRITIMNPFTTEVHFTSLLDRIKKIANHNL